MKSFPQRICGSSVLKITLVLIAVFSILECLAAPVLRSLVINAPAQMKAGTSSAVYCYAYYSNGTVKTVSPRWVVANSQVAYFYGNRLYARSTSAGKAVAIAAYYGNKSACKAISFVAPITAIAISGKDQIDPGTVGTYNCIVRYPSGQTAVVPATWTSSRPALAAFLSNRLYVNSAAGGKYVTLSASYGGYTARKSVYVNNKVTRLSIIGVSSLDAGSSAAFSCRAYYSDGTSKIVTPTWTSSHPSLAYFSGSRYYAKSSAGGYTLKITATYGGRSTTQSIKINNVQVGLTISGASSVKSGSRIYLRCYAKYSNGTSKEVTPTWYWVTQRVSFYGLSQNVTYHASLYTDGEFFYKIALPTSQNVTVRAVYGNYRVDKTITLLAGSSDSSNGTSNGSSSTSMRISGSSSLTAGKSSTYYLYYGGKKVTSGVVWNSGLYLTIYNNLGGARAVAYNPPSSKGSTYITATYMGKTIRKSITVYKK